MVVSVLWFASLVLMAVSLVLLGKTTAGRGAVLRIGGEALAQRGEGHDKQRQPLRLSDIVVGYTGLLVGVVLVVLL